VACRNGGVPVDGAGTLGYPTGERQSQLQLSQIETNYLPEYGTKIPNHNTQITNNIKITNSNDQNITATYWIARVILSVLSFEFRSLVFV
jgi:hypothetical protein